MTPENPLDVLGWAPFLQQQLTLEELEDAEHNVPARVFAVQRTGLLLQFESADVEIPLGGRWFELPVEERPTVGDWVLLNPAQPAIVRLLERKSLLKRMGAGGTELQLIAANVDTMFLVSSCNDEFNLSRMERYLSLALEAGVQPVIVLTKADLADSPEEFRDAAMTLRRDLIVEVVNALESETLAGLKAWMTRGQTVALLGSSGVGKSTLINSLIGQQVQLTRDIREDDARGRHTTSSRSLHLIPGGGLVVDSPGMRELGIADAQAGVASMFDDIEILARECRFADCGHDTEPGCRVRESIAEGDLDGRRLDSYRKLKREELYNTETIADRHTRTRQWSKGVRNVLKSSHKRRD
jgi:ribosome biogenesis GTPase